MHRRLRAPQPLQGEDGEAIGESQGAGELADLSRTRYPSVQDVTADDAQGTDSTDGRPMPGRGRGWHPRDSLAVEYLVTGSSQFASLFPER